MRLSAKIAGAVTSVLALIGSVSAAGGSASGGTSTILPPIIQEFFDTMGKGGSGVASFITTRLQFLVYLILGLIIAFAVGFSIKAGIKYIQSEGDPGKIEEAQKAIKAIMFGVAAIFVGIVGIILVYVIFGQGAVAPGFPQVCLSAGESVGCKSYYNDGINDPVVQWCEGYYVAATQLNLDGTDSANATTIATQAGPGKGGYTFPPTAKGVDKGGALYASSVGNAGLLCINPSKGGYLPTV